MRPLIVTIPLRTGGGLNGREHHFARARRVASERSWTQYALFNNKRPRLPCSVTLTRIAPSNGMDDDNLVGALKAVRDQVAAWLGVDDKRSQVVAYRYAQDRGPWGVRIEFGPTGGVSGVVEIATREVKA